MPTNPGYRHGPSLDSQRKRCPVCHQSAYSPAGIHPQCAIKRSEGAPPGPPPPVEDKPESPVAVVPPLVKIAVKKVPAAR